MSKALKGFTLSTSTPVKRHQPAPDLPPFQWPQCPLQCIGCWERTQHSCLWSEPCSKFVCTTCTPEKEVAAKVTAHSKPVSNREHTPLTLLKSMAFSSPLSLFLLWRTLTCIRVPLPLIATEEGGSRVDSKIDGTVLALLAWEQKEEKEIFMQTQKAYKEVTVEREGSSRGKRDNKWRGGRRRKGKI